MNEKDGALVIIASVRVILGEIDLSFRDLDAICSDRDLDWRREVVRRRRDVATRMGNMSDLLAKVARPSEPLIAFRNSFSQLRHAVAELQAAWPAVTLDPDAQEYREGVDRIRAGMRAIDRALVACERDGLDPS